MDTDRMHILLVEDSETHIALIRAALEEDPRIVLTVARTIAEARVRLANWEPDLAIVDFMLPDGTGIELLSADVESAAFPVIIMTGGGDERVAVKAMKAGALDYLVKSPEVLADMPHIVERARREWVGIVEHRRTTAALRESEERFRSVFVTAAAGMVIVSPTGKIVNANPAFCSYTGYDENELKETTLDDITHPEDRERTLTHLGEVFAGDRQGIHFEKRYVRKDGGIVWGHASFACVMDKDRQPLYCVGLVQDITERQRMEAELKEANRELDAFVYTVSHDFRSHLTPIIGYSQLLKDNLADSCDEATMTLVEDITRQGYRMLAS